MLDNSSYLLRNDDQVRNYLERYGSFFRRAADEWMAWIAKLDFGVRVPLDLEPGWEEAVIGMLCVLYRNRQINITFNRTATAIRRDPADMDEYNRWIAGTGIRLRSRKK